MKRAQEILQNHLAEYAIKVGMDVNDIEKDAFDMAIAAMEEYASQSKWISVEERLPEINTPVLVFVSNPFFKDNNVHNSYYDYVFTDGSVCWRGIESNVHRYPDDLIKVTHWQPLHSPPKTEK